MADPTKGNSLAGRWLNSSLPHEWFYEVIDQLQLAACRVVHSDPDHMRDALEAVAAMLPRPDTQVEDVILRGLLIEFAGRFGNAFHERHHRQAPEGSGTCGFAPFADLERFWTCAGDTIEGFRRWIRGFFDRFERTHPRSQAEQAARFIDEHFDQPLDVQALASMLNISRSRLVVTFRDRYGVSPREFQRMVRLAEALTHVKGEKVEALALRVGYKSRKNFYAAFRKVTGLTPAEFRKLPDRDIGEVIESIDFRLTLGGRRTRARSGLSHHSRAISES